MALFLKMARADRSSDVLEVSGAGSIDVNGIYTQDTDGVWKMRGRYTGADYQIVSVDVSNKKRIPIPEEHREPKVITCWRLSRKITGLDNEVYHEQFYAHRSIASAGDEIPQFPPETGWEAEVGSLPGPTCNLRRAGLERSVESVSEVFTTVWNQRKFTDAELVCDGRRIPVHRSAPGLFNTACERPYQSSFDEMRSESLPHSAGIFH